MPDLIGRRSHELRLQRAISSMFRRWSRELSVNLRPVSPDEKDIEAIQLALSKPFISSSSALAKQFKLALSGNVTTLGVSYVQSHGRVLAQLIADSTNRQIASRLDKETRAELGLKEGLLDIGAKVLKWAKGALLSVKRAASIAITEVTRAAVKGEQLIATAINVFREKAQNPIDPLGTQGQNKASVEVIGEVIGEITPIWYTERDGLVCPLCAPLHKKPRHEWPLGTGDGPPRHHRCRCWLEWELRELE